MGRYRCTQPPQVVTPKYTLSLTPPSHAHTHAMHVSSMMHHVMYYMHCMYHYEVLRMGARMCVRTWGECVHTSYPSWYLPNTLRMQHALHVMHYMVYHATLHA